MNKSKAPLVMLEQMVMLLVFALAAALCLQAFVKSDAASRESEARDRAANLCQSMAEIMRTNGGDSQAAANAVFGSEWQCDPAWFIVPLNEDMTPDMTSKPSYQDAAYRLEIYPPSCRTAGLDGATIMVMKREPYGEVLFSIDVMWQVEVTQ